MGGAGDDVHAHDVGHLFGRAQSVDGHAGGDGEPGIRGAQLVQVVGARPRADVGGGSVAVPPGGCLVAEGTYRDLGVGIMPVSPIMAGWTCWCVSTSPSSPSRQDSRC